MQREERVLWVFEFGRGLSSHAAAVAVAGAAGAASTTTTYSTAAADVISPMRMLLITRYGVVRMIPWSCKD